MRFVLCVSVYLVLLLRTSAWANSSASNKDGVINEDIRKAAETGYVWALRDAACTGRITVADTMVAYQCALRTLKTNLLDHAARSLLETSMFLMRRHRAMVFVDPLKEVLAWRDPKATSFRREAAKTLYYITRDKAYARMVVDGDDDQARAGTLEAIAIAEPECANEWVEHLGGMRKRQEKETFNVMGSISVMEWMRGQCVGATNIVEVLVNLMPVSLMHVSGMEEYPMEDAPPYQYLLREFRREYRIQPERIRQRLTQYAVSNPTYKRFVTCLLMQLEGGDSVQLFPGGDSGRR